MIGLVDTMAGLLAIISMAELKSIVRQLNKYHHAPKFGHWRFGSKVGRCNYLLYNGRTLSQNINGRTLEHDDICQAVAVGLYKKNQPDSFFLFF